MAEQAITDYNDETYEAETFLPVAYAEKDEIAEMQEAILLATSPEYQPERIDVEVVKLLVSRLAQVLAHEVDLLDEMRIAELADLQPEKKALVDALEKQQRLLERRGSLRAALTEEERADFEELISIFNAVCEENHTRLLIAREVNKRVVQAITELAQEQSRQGIYTKKGQHADDVAISVSLNHSI